MLNLNPSLCVKISGCMGSDVFIFVATGKGYPGSNKQTGFSSGRNAKDITKNPNEPMH